MNLISKIFFSSMILFAVIGFFAGLFLVVQVEEFVFGCLIDDRVSLFEKYFDTTINCDKKDFIKNSIIWIVGTGAYFYLMLYCSHAFKKEWKKRRWNLSK